MPAIWRRLGRSHAAVVGFAALGISTVAFAGPVPPNFLMTFDASSDAAGPSTFNWLDGYGYWGHVYDHPIPMSDQTWTGWRYWTGPEGDPYGPIYDPGGMWQLEWDVVFSDSLGGVAGPGGGAFVTANIVVTNNDPFNTQNFTLLMSLPVGTPILSPFEFGSVVGTVSDQNFDSALVSAPAGASIYTSRIDTVDEVLLMADPFSQGAGFLQTAAVGPADFGVPNALPASQAVDSSIAIFLNFDLSPGDAASFTSIFQVQVIPGPGGLSLLAVFGLLSGRRRRRG